MIKTALLGHGYWGSKLERYIKENKNFDLVHICNSKTDMSKVWPNVEAVVVATPINTHYKVVKEALLNNCHVFCEKPLTKKTKECLELKKLAEKKKLTLCVDYTWTFSKSLREAQKIDFGKIKYIDIIINRPKRKGTKENVYWLLGVHAMSIREMFPPSKYPSAITTDSNSHIKRTTVVIWGAKKNILLDLGKEKDNLEYAVGYFYNVIKGKEKTNLDTAILITKTIEYGNI